ncbi:MAG TPA: hypothetical protein VGM82_00200 [Gemmatimonadaceae bacterium]|jgi:hypothetical protein
MLFAAAPSYLHAQLLKRLARAAINPIGFAQQQIVQTALGAPARRIASVGLNPAAVIVDNDDRIVDGLRDYIHAAAQSGIMAVGNSFNPAFVQTVFVMKELRRRGILSTEQQCRAAANRVGDAVLLESGLSTNPGAQWWTNSLGDAACATSENMLEQTRRDRAAAGLPTSEVPMRAAYNAVFQNGAAFLPSPIGRCVDAAEPRRPMVIMSDGAVISPRAPGDAFLPIARVFLDPTGFFFAVYQQTAPPYFWFGIARDGAVLGRNQFGQLVQVGACEI